VFFFHGEEGETWLQAGTIPTTKDGRQEINTVSTMVTLSKKIHVQLDNSSSLIRLRRVDELKHHDRCNDGEMDHESEESSERSK